MRVECHAGADGNHACNGGREALMLKLLLLLLEWKQRGLLLVHVVVGLTRCSVCELLACDLSISDGGLNKMSRLVRASVCRDCFHCC